jgi:hypothetical protein
MALSPNEANALAKLQETALPCPETEIVHYVRMVRDPFVSADCRTDCRGLSLRTKLEFKLHVIAAQLG